MHESVRQCCLSGGNDNPRAGWPGPASGGFFKASTRVRAWGTLVLREGFETSSQMRSLAAYTCTIPHGEFFDSIFSFVFVVLPYAVDGERGGQGGERTGGLTDRQMGGAFCFCARGVCELSSSCLSALTTLNALFRPDRLFTLGTNVPEGREQGLAGWLA